MYEFEEKVKSVINAVGVDVGSYTFNKEISEYLPSRERGDYLLSSAASALPTHRCAGRIVPTGGETGRGELDARAPHVS